MKVEQKITFTKDELIAMCLDKCRDIVTPVPGTFEAEYHYTDSVICTFISDEERAAKAKREAEYQERMAKRNAHVAEPLAEALNAISAEVPAI